MTSRHAIVWVDHSEARVLFIDPDDVEKSIVFPAVHPHLHVMRGAVGSGHAAEDQHYYRDIGLALADAGEILIAGPGQAKLVLFKYLQRHDAALAERVLGIETTDHPTDRQLIAHAKTYFKLKDRML